MLNIASNTFVARRTNNVSGGLEDGVYDSFTKEATDNHVSALEDRVIDWRGSGNDQSNTLYDPSGWLSTTAEAGSGWWSDEGLDWPAGTLLTLPAGIYYYQSQILLDDPATAGKAYIYLDRADDPSESTSTLLQASPNLMNAVSPGSLEGKVAAFFAGAWVTDVEERVVPTIFAEADFEASPEAAVRVELTIARIE